MECFEPGRFQPLQGSSRLSAGKRYRSQEYD